MKTKKMRFDINTWLPIIIFVLYESDNYTAIQNLEELGFENGKDFFVVARFMSFLDGGFA